VRSIRAEYAVPPGQAIRATVAHPSPELRGALAMEQMTIQRLAKLSALELQDADGHLEDAAGAVLSDGTAVSVPLGDLVDLEKECARLAVEHQRLTELIESQHAKLSNEQFVSRAPAAVVQKERDKLASWREQAGVLSTRRQRLGC
jgi:valyl-tRNA synthetase